MRTVCRSAAVLFLAAASLLASAQQSVFQIETPGLDPAVSQFTQSVIEDAAREFDHRLPLGMNPIYVRVCATVDEFAALAGNFAQPNVTGIAIPSESRIIIKAPALVPPHADFRGTIRHELVHILLERNVNVDRLPRWLNEGIAMYLSKEHRWDSTFQVAQMYMQNSLIPYHELDLVLQQAGAEMEFGSAYAQSLSMTRFLIDQLGEDVFWDLIRDLDIMSFGDTLRLRLDMLPIDFYDAWVRSLTSTSWSVSLISGITLFQIMAIITIYAYWRKKRRGDIRLEQWAREDAAEDARRWPPSRQADFTEPEDGNEYESPIYDDEPLQPWEEDEEEDVDEDDDDDSEYDSQGRRAWWK